MSFLIKFVACWFVVAGFLCAGFSVMKRARRKRLARGVHPYIRRA